MTGSQAVPAGRLLVFSTKGSASNDEQRIVTLLGSLPHELFAFDRARKLRSCWNLLRRVARSAGPLVLVMEGTGIAGGLACILSRLLGHRYVISSGDAVGPFVRAHSRLAGPWFAIYERVLCRFSAGFIGWTPYLVGRALTFGCPRGVTAPGWVIGGDDTGGTATRQATRESWGIANDTIVFGLLGSLVWNKRHRYCYGLELVRAIRKTSRQDIAVVIVGGGSGWERLRDEAGPDLGHRVFLPGPCALNQVMANVRGFDIASLPQSTDAVGAFRYTTKIAEYESASLPIVVTQIPASYDLDYGQFCRLPGTAPWDDTFIHALAEYMNRVTRNDLPVPRNHGDKTFDRDQQVQRVEQFLRDIVNNN